MLSLDFEIAASSISSAAEKKASSVPYLRCCAGLSFQLAGSSSFIAVGNVQSARGKDTQSGWSCCSLKSVAIWEIVHVPFSRFLLVVAKVKKKVFFCPCQSVFTEKFSLGNAREQSAMLRSC